MKFFCQTSNPIIFEESKDYILYKGGTQIL
jgi:hypothetical protein